MTISPSQLSDRSGQRRFFDLLEGTRFPGVLLDLDGRIAACNDALEALLGWSAQELAGRDWFEICVPAGDAPARRAAWLDAIAQGGFTRRSEREVVTRSGERRVLECDLIAVRDDAGKVLGMVAIGLDITETRRASEKLLHDAFHDAVTGLPNRALFMDRLSHRLSLEKRRQETSFSVLLLDVDRFKVVNDSLGHASGDLLLREVAQRLASCLRDGDTVARLGGDEFAILLEDVRSPGEARRVGERLQEALRTSFSIAGQEVFTGVSVGVVHGHAQYALPEDILRDADIALYRAKAQGRGRSVEFDPSMHARAVALLQLETDLRRALERRELILHYQPVVSLSTGAITGSEALIRWMHPERGMVPPGEFIPLAEETGLIVDIGEWVLTEACRQTREWQDQLGQPELEIAVNLSSRQFQQPGLVARVVEVLQTTGLSPRSLRLEVTESLLMDKDPQSADAMTELRAMGVRIDLDDFGTGYSSLSYLHQFPIDTLKIDRSFTARIGVTDEGLEIVHTILSLASSLGMEVVAEGVETAQQLSELRRMNCGFAQGYHLSRPVAHDRFAALLAERKSWPPEGTQVTVRVLP